MWGINAQRFVSSGSLSSSIQLELLHITVPLKKFIWCMSHRGFALGNLGLSLRGEEAPKSECLCVQRVIRAPVSSLEQPAAIGLWS